MSELSRARGATRGDGVNGAQVARDGARILVLGGGFGGVYAALHLERMLAQHSGVEITLVSRENFFLFTPMLHEVAASDLDITHIESLCNLEALIGRGQFTFIGLPMKWRGGTASPIRAVAVFDM